MKKNILIIAFCLISVFSLFLLSSELAAQQSSSIISGAGAPQTQNLSFKLDMEGGSFSKAVNIVILMTLLSLAPSAVMMLTSFTRIVIVIAFLKQAMGMQVPSQRIVAGLALMMTVFIMQPVWNDIYTNAIEPYSQQKISDKEAWTKSVTPLKEFMLKQTRESSMLLFMDLSGMEPVESPEDLPMSIIMPAFMISELKTAFQMGFLIYLPFLLVDVVVSTVLMSMGMMMLPPAMVSMPFKILLFILVDGWELMVRSLVMSFA